MRRLKKACTHLTPVTVQLQHAIACPFFGQAIAIYDSLSHTKRAGFKGFPGTKNKNSGADRMTDKRKLRFWEVLGELGYKAARHTVFWGLALALGGTGTSLVQAKAATEATLSAAGATVALSELPVQGQAVMQLIYQGGPFSYDKDGTVFGNREKLLPFRQRGYYREYTVRTPGERSRGARRIVCGGQQPTAPDACFYTADHYASFRQIVQQAK